MEFSSKEGIVSLIAFVILEMVPFYAGNGPLPKNKDPIRSFITHGNAVN
jgi:hypothetical protein